MSKITYKKKELKIVDPSIEFAHLIKSLEVVDKTKVSLKNVVALTKNNANEINKIIKADPTYNVGLAETTFNLLKADRVLLENNKEALYVLLREIDIDNSTQMFRFDKSLPFNEMVSYIQDPNNKFFDKLLDPNGFKYLPEELAAQIKSSDKKHSLPSKICKYLLEFLSTPKNTDKYFISDKVVRKMLIVYLNAYGIQNELRGLGSGENLSYKEYFDYLKKLQDKVNHGLDSSDPNYMDKHDIDHIIWYSYKSLI